MSVIKPALQRPELISYFLGANNYSWLHFRSGEKKLLAKPISYLEEELPGFIRVHKTVLINPTYVESLNKPPRQKMAGEIRLDSGEVFPVSRRRWQQVADALESRLLAENADHEDVDGAVRSDSASIVGNEDRTALSILLITDDAKNALLAKQAIEKRWPAYQFHMAKKSSHIPDLLRPLPRQDYPILLLLDARTITLERLHTLQRLKEDSQLSHIPVIVLVAPTDQLVIESYKQKANSVISMPEGYVPFAQTVERVCQFWLRTVALPGVSR